MFKKLLLVVLCLCFVVPQGFAANLENLVPADADLVIRANIQQILEIPELKAQLDETLKSEEAKKYEAILDIKKDITSVVVFVPLDSVNKANPSASNIGMIAEGKFDVEKILNEVKNNKEATELVKITEEDGLQTVYYNDNKGSESKVVFLDANTVIMGTVTGVNTVKAVKAGKAQAISTKKEFAASLAKVSQAAQLAGVFAFPESAKQAVASNEQMAELAKINFIRFGLTKMEDLSIEIAADFSEGANVENVKTAIDGMIKMLSSNPAPYSAVEDFVKNYSSKAEGKSFVITSKVTKESIEKVIASKGAPEKDKVAPKK